MSFKSNQIIPHLTSTQPSMGDLSIFQPNARGLITLIFVFMAESSFMQCEWGCPSQRPDPARRHIQHRKHCRETNARFLSHPNTFIKHPVVLFQLVSIRDISSASRASILLMIHNAASFHRAWFHCLISLLFSRGRAALFSMFSPQRSGH